MFKNNLDKIIKIAQVSFINIKNILLALIILYAIPQNPYTFKSLYNLYASPVKLNESHFILDKDIKLVEDKLTKYKNSKLLWLSGPPSGLGGPQFGAITGLTLFHRPNNLSENNFKSFLSSYAPTHVLFCDLTASKKKRWLFNLINDNYKLEKACDFLFKINY